MLVGEDGRVEFPVGMITEETKLEGATADPPLGPVGTVGEPIKAEEVVLAFPEIEGIAEVEIPVLAPMGAELLAAGILDGGGCIDEAGGTPEVRVELPVEESDAPRPPPEIDGWPI